MKAKQTPVPKGLPQILRWATARARKQGYEAWITRKEFSREAYPGSAIRGFVTMWMLWIKEPKHLKVLTKQFERTSWSHARRAGKPPTSETAWLAWNKDYAAARWKAMCDNEGWERIL